MKEAEEALITLRGPLRRFSAQEELLQIQKSINDQPQFSLMQQVLRPDFAFSLSDMLY